MSKDTNLLLYGVYGFLLTGPAIMLGKLVDSPGAIAAKRNNELERAHWKQLGLN